MVMPSFLHSCIWRATGFMSEVPLTLFDALSAPFDETRPAPAGSVTAVNRIGVVLSRPDATWVAPVPMVSIRSTPFDINVLTMVVIVSSLPCAFWSSKATVLPAAFIRRVSSSWKPLLAAPRASCATG